MPRGQIQPERIKKLIGEEPARGHYVLYWMQQSQRAEHNHALEFAVARANALNQPLVVGFSLMDDYPEANVRHYGFMLEGLSETQAALKERGIKMVVRLGSPPDVALDLAQRASLVVCDRGYLRHQKAWRKQVAREAPCPVTQVESDVIVPVEAASEKAEYAARTIRPKIMRLLPNYLAPLSKTRLRNPSLRLSIAGTDLRNPDAILRKLRLERSIEPANHLFRGGTGEAKRVFREFLRKRFTRYTANRNQPHTDDVSHMGMYLHFGQISPVYLAMEAQRADVRKENKEAFIEELAVRRELAVNFVEYVSDYDKFACLPEWARKTLAKHDKNKREHVYTQRELESAQTHDPYWNAAMNEMRFSGYMHNYMRMYWGKKVLEWSKTPQQAFRTLLHINNKYFLDGRDPNSYAGVAWVFGMHDRPWGERPIFGTVRYMSASGLERKCDIQSYVAKTEALRSGS